MILLFARSTVLQDKISLDIVLTNGQKREFTTIMNKLLKLKCLYYEFYENL